MVREVTALEENQYWACLEKQQYFNSEMPEETAGAPQSICKSYAKLWQTAEQAGPSTHTGNLAFRKPQVDKGACRHHPGYWSIFLVVCQQGSLLDLVIPIKDSSITFLHQTG